MKILVVDDSAAVRMQIRQELETEGYEVFEAKDGVEAFKILLTVRPDLITLDVNMPNMDGYEACQKLRSTRYSQLFTTEKGARIPVIFVTATDTLEGRARGFEAGGADFIVKPFQKGELKDVVNRRLKPQNLLKGLSALVVDDSDTTRHIIADVLKDLGIHVEEAANGLEAFEYLSAHIGSIDLVISDLVMPDMGGEVLCRKIREELHALDIPIIILTAMSEHNALLELFDAGATDYLIKPFVKEELIARLNVHLQVRLLNRELQQRIDALKKMDTLKNQFLAACSHDLRSPLHGILGLTNVMMKDDTLGDNVKEMVALIHQSGDYLYSLIVDILDLHSLISDDHELSMMTISLNDLARSCMETLKYMALPKNIALTLVEDTTASAAIMGDGLALKRVLNNLLSNAIKFTPRGRKITISTSAPDEKRRALSISDTGTGISGSTIQQILKKQKLPSLRGTEGEKGTGLGLPIIMEIIEKHNGELRITSEEGKGSTFTVILPARLLE
jgi:CheY-like chemotaxis protein/two-component sensor histidine kinase